MPDGTARVVYDAPETLVHSSAPKRSPPRKKYLRTEFFEHNTTEPRTFAGHDNRTRFSRRTGRWVRHEEILPDVRYVRIVI